MNRAAVGRSVVGALVALSLGCQAGGSTQLSPPPPAPSLPPPVAAAPTTATVLVPPLPTNGACASATAPTGPAEYGQCVLARAMTQASCGAKITLLLASDQAAAGVPVETPPESYSIVSSPDETRVVGRDAAGVMYGAMDLAERVDEHGCAALPLATPVRTTAVLKYRAANLFLTLPEPGEHWWFRDLTFWTEYLDMMAKGRLNFLDLHGMYDIKSTIFPNALLYFATSASFPEAGVPRAEREANLITLNLIINMAAVRGIQVGLMSYRADLDPLGAEKESREEQAEVPTYTRQAVADLATRAPGLSFLGFRVGESARPPGWYTSTYIAGLKDAHAKAVAYTRTWLAKKADLIHVVEASGPETIVEAKYNGEQLGPPYIISGGGMEKWHSYSYQDFLEPPAPYQFVFQIRAGGTHRLFRYASYTRTRRAIVSMLMSPRVAGFTLEAAHAYLPQRDFYHANPADSFSPWAFRRDELSYLLFGRLGYDPNTPESVFRAILKHRVGTDALWDAVQAASDITPWILAGHTCGPDQRDYAPELELGGPVSYWATPSLGKPPHDACGKPHQPFDAFAVAMPNEAAADLLERRGTSRLSPVELSHLVLEDAKAARAATQVPIDSANPEARDVVRECVALADLGEWFAHKYRGATALAVYEGSGSAPWLEAARAETREAVTAYEALARDTAYIAPFDEHMRMRKKGLTNFHWQKQVPRLYEEAASIDETVEIVRKQQPPRRAKGPLPDPKVWLTTPRHAGPGLTSLVVSPDDARAREWTVTVTLAAPPPRGAVVKVLHRTFRSDGRDWEFEVATGHDTTWTARVHGSTDGEMFAVEVNAGPGQAWRYPDVIKETPYRALAP